MMELVSKAAIIDKPHHTDVTIPAEEKCTRHGYINVAMNIDTGDYFCNSCIYDHECTKTAGANTNGICGCNLIFLAKLGKDLGREYEEAHRELLCKAKQMEEFSTDSIQKQLKERRLVFMEKFKSMVWDLHPKIMNLFRQNPILIELEETLDSVKEYFVGFNEDAKRGFREEVEEIEILNKNGHFAYVCSRMDYYKDLERRMEEATVRINKTTARAKILVNQLTDFKLSKDFLRKMLQSEFERRNLNNSDSAEKSTLKVNLINNQINVRTGPNLIRKPAPAQEQKVILENLPSQTVKQQNEEGKAINHTTVEGKEINLSEEEINEIIK